MPMSPRLLRPRASGATHPEALDWATRVTANGGTVSSTTLAAVSKFCADIQAAGIRDRFYRLNLFCGDQLAAALVPLYRAESSTASARGNATDTNNNFVSGDYNETGSSSGLVGNQSTKHLNTGVAAISMAMTNAHLGVGLRTADSGSAGYRAAIGATTSTTAPTSELSLSTRRGDSSSRAAIFGTFNNVSHHAGQEVFSAALAVGNLVMAYPSFYRNGSAVGDTASASSSGTTANAITVFAINAGSIVGHTNARINWYSIGLTMTAAQVASFTTAVAAFNLTLGRT